jgi:hypothetical protein
MPPETLAPDMDMTKLMFLRDLVHAAPDPEAESFPLLELAQSIINSAITPAELYRRAVAMQSRPRWPPSLKRLASWPSLQPFASAARGRHCALILDSPHA